MFVSNANLIEEYLIFESNQILLENIQKNPKKFFIISEEYKKYVSPKDYALLEESIWDTIKSVTGKVGDYFSSSPRKAIQGIADVASIIDPTGIVDLVNGIFYYYFKDYFSAFFSFLGALLVLPGFLLSLTGAGAVVGVPMIVAGKAVKGVKLALKAGKLTSVSAKEVGIITRLAIPGFETLGALLTKLPFGSGIGKWLSSSAQKIEKAAFRKGAKIEDIAKTLGASSSEISKSPVVKSLTSKVVNVAKKRFKPSKLQAAFAGVGTYGMWTEMDEEGLRKVAIAQLTQGFKEEGMEFDINAADSEQYINLRIGKLDRERRNCGTEQQCKSAFQKLIEKYPSITTALTSMLKVASLGADALEATDLRSQ